VLRWERVSLDDYRRPRLHIVASCSHRNDVATLHLASNSETASLQRIASSSAPGSNFDTCRAIRLRTIGDRASGTIKRSSRMPCARRRSRIALIPSDASAIHPHCNANIPEAMRWCGEIAGPAPCVETARRLWIPNLTRPARLRAPSIWYRAAD
jgi:hypothetical protein